MHNSYLHECTSLVWGVCWNLQRSEMQLVVAEDELLSLLSVSLWSGGQAAVTHLSIILHTMAVMSLYWPHGVCTNRLFFQILLFLKIDGKRDSLTTAWLCLMFRCLDKLIAYNILLFTNDSHSVYYEPLASSVSGGMTCFTVVLLFWKQITSHQKEVF